MSGRANPPLVRRVLIAFDGSTGAEEALRDLGNAGLPDRLDACVLSVPDPAVFYEREAGESAGGESHRVLARGRTGACLHLAEQACGMLRTMFPSWNVTAAATDGPAAPAIIATALEQRSDMVLMGAHGRSHCQQMLLGSCSRRVLMHGPCPVRIARPRRRLAGGNLRLLVAVDHDDARGRATVAGVTARSWPANTEVHLIAVVDGGADQRDLSPEAALGAWKHRHGAEADARACGALEEYWEILRRAGCNGETILFEGNGPLTLVRYATEWEADCVFVALPPREGLNGPLAEDPAFIAAACAPCSVEVVRWPNPSPEATSARVTAEARAESVNTPSRSGRKHSGRKRP